MVETLNNQASSLKNAEDPQTMVNFSNAIQNLTATAIALDMNSYIVNPQLITQILSKLPMFFQYQWARQDISELKISECLLYWIFPTGIKKNLPLHKLFTSLPFEKSKGRKNNLVFLGIENVRTVENDSHSEY
ncbi:hypothetical protein HHI36_008339 [Cryptolaemus montrouzieri]|uniref:Uncharacterized protein n=1 Tax=Cryptolaemus montrouzieri TaxID=559131 RepID=A0ABD2MS33_9CUCU